MLKPKCSLSIVIPVFNEAGSILQVLQKVAEYQNCNSLVSTQTIVVDDGSTDESVEILLNEPTLYTQLIKLRENKGKGAAIRKALEIVSTDYILIQDSDAEYSPHEYVKYFDYIVTLSPDLLLTSRFSGSEITRVHYFWHKVGNKVITLIFNLLHNTTFTDIYSGHVIFKKNLVDPRQLRVNRWGQQAELLSLICTQRPAMFEIPISYFGRTYEQGKKIRAWHIIEVIYAIFKSRLIVKNNENR